MPLRHRGLKGNSKGNLGEMAHKGIALLATALMLYANTGFAAPGTALPSCTVARAHYHLSSESAFELSFVKVGKRDGWVSDLALKLTPTIGPAYWFLFDEGSARYINLISTTDVTLKGWDPPTDAKGNRPLGMMHYFAWSRDYRFDDSAPASATLAPERIFLPDLADAMWYRASPRQGLSQGVFLLDGCR